MSPFTFEPCDPEQVTREPMTSFKVRPTVPDSGGHRQGFSGSCCAWSPCEVPGTALGLMCVSAHWILRTIVQGGHPRQAQRNEMRCLRSEAALLTIQRKLVPFSFPFRVLCP